MILVSVDLVSGTGLVMVRGLLLFLAGGILC